MDLPPGETDKQIWDRSPEARAMREQNVQHPRDLDAMPRTPPSINPIEAARERTANFVHNICMSPLLELQKRQDEINNATARIQTSERALNHYIGEFAKFCAEAEQLASDLKPIVAALVEPFAQDPPSTITQLKNGEPK